MSVNQIVANNKLSKNKRGQMTRPSSGIIESDLYTGFRSDIENDSISPSYKNRLYNLFRQIEKEFDLLYQENQTLHEKIELLNEKLERDTYEKTESVDLDSNISKVLSKKFSTTNPKNKTAHKLKAQTSKIVSSFKAPQFGCALLREYIGHKDGIWEVSVARPGIPVVGTASADHTACLWSIENSKCLLQYQGHIGSVNSIRFHPAKDLVLTGSGDCSAHIWQAALNWDIPKGHSSEEELEGDDLDEKSEFNKVSTLRTPFQELTGHTGAVSSAEWLAGADQIITASWDRLAILHDVETGSIVTTLTGHDQELNNASTHPTQKLAVTSSRDTTFRLWDFRENVHSVSVFQGHAESVTSAVFTREDKVISSSDDRTVKVWDLRNMRSPVATIRVESSVNRLSVSINGVIAIPHDNRHIRLFDISGQRLARLPRSSRQGHNRMVTSVAWAEDFVFGVNLFTAGFDRKVLGWSVQSMKD
ncbi:WD repeat-containing protein 37 isoform X1 [Diorhabda sublineata]|uniref:WD repeat-containing protein 37 isoform X1 n=2 Tax=Diorhabda sublineata TaxID=1163346 RepID=UPI0024E08FE0|nr:WD repeat-containing protein 37 isoform X1 [Diorhabda sublineata]